MGHSPTSSRMTLGCRGGQTLGAAEALADRLKSVGPRSCPIEADFEDTEAPRQIFEQVIGELGPVGALVLGHCESVDSGIMDTTVESFDRHFAVNTRAGWLLIREYASQFAGDPGSGRIVALTSDATVGNVPYGA